MLVYLKFCFIRQYWITLFSLCFVSLESHNQWGRPGGPQGAVVGSSVEEAEGDGNSMISQTVAMAIAGTSTASPMSRPSSFLLNSQVTSVTEGLQGIVTACYIYWFYKSSSSTIQKPFNLGQASYSFFLLCVPFLSLDSYRFISPGESSAWKLLSWVES